MFTPREHEILDEHLHEWYPRYDQGETPDLGELEEHLADRIRELDDEPTLKAELETILGKYQGVKGLAKDDHPLLLEPNPRDAIVAGLVAEGFSPDDAAMAAASDEWMATPEQLKAEELAAKPVSEKRLNAAVGKALDTAFWISIAESFPEVTSGDMAPGDDLPLQRAAQAAVKIWLFWNHPAMGPEREELGYTAPKPYADGETDTRGTEPGLAEPPANSAETARARARGIGGAE